MESRNELTWPLYVNIPVLRHRLDFSRLYWPSSVGRTLVNNYEVCLNYVRYYNLEEFESKGDSIRAKKIRCYLQEENDLLRTMLCLEVDVMVVDEFVGIKKHTSACVRLEMENAKLRQMVWTQYLYSPGPPGSPGGLGMLACADSFRQESLGTPDQ